MSFLVRIKCGQMLHALIGLVRLRKNCSVAVGGKNKLKIVSKMKGKKMKKKKRIKNYGRKK